MMLSSTTLFSTCASGLAVHAHGRCAPITLVAHQLLTSALPSVMDEADGAQQPGSVERHNEATLSDMQWCRYAFMRDVPPPAPFGIDDLARVSLSPLLSVAECKALIAAADETGPGWQRDATDRYDTPANRLPARFPIHEMFASSRAAHELLHKVVLPRVIPMARRAFCRTPKFEASVPRLDLAFARIVKYDAHLGEVELGFHRDGPLVTCNIALNSNYEGGGTVIEALKPGANLDQELPGSMLASAVGDGSAIVMPAGHALVHPGHISHAGAPIRSGVRWVLVCHLDPCSA